VVLIQVEKWRILAIEGRPCGRPRRRGVCWGLTEAALGESGCGGRDLAEGAVCGEAGGLGDAVGADQTVAAGERSGWRDGFLGFEGVGGGRGGEDGGAGAAGGSRHGVQGV